MIASHRMANPNSDTLGIKIKASVEFNFYFCSKHKDAQEKKNFLIYLFYRTAYD